MKHSSRSWTPATIARHLAADRMRLSLSACAASAVLAAILLCSGNAFAQYGPPLGKIYLSFSPNSLVQDLQVTPNVPFDFYLITQIDFADIGHPEWNSTRGISAFELALAIPPSLVVQKVEYVPLGTQPTKSDLHDGVLDLLVALGSGGAEQRICVLAQATPQVLLHFRAVVLVPVRSAFLAIEPDNPSSFDLPGGPGGAAGWASCPDTNTLYPFAEVTQPGTVVLNRNLVTTEQSSWGSVKARYAE